MTFKAKALLGVTFLLLFSFSIFLHEAHSMHGMENFEIQDFRYDADKQFIYFKNVFEELTAIYQYDLKKDQISLFENPEYLNFDDKALPFFKLKSLKQVNPRSLDLSFSEKFKGDLDQIFIPNKEKIPPLEKYEGPYGGPNSQKFCPYEITVKQGKRKIQKVKINPCCIEYYGLMIRAYDIPQSPDLFLALHYTQDCHYIGGYTRDSLYLLHGIKKSKPSGKADKGKNIKMPLQEFKYSTILNNQGYQAYKNKQYDIAMEYFEAAFFDPHLRKIEQKKHFLALFNLAATEAKVGKNDKALEHLSLLLSHEKTKKKYLKKIKKDKDFDGLRNEAGFKSLILSAR